MADKKYYDDDIRIREDPTPPPVEDKDFPAPAKTYEEDEEAANAENKAQNEPLSGKRAGGAGWLQRWAAKPRKTLWKCSWGEGGPRISTAMQRFTVS